MKYIGWASSTLLLICGLPELYYGIKTGHVGMSTAFLVMWFLGEILGLTYVLLMRNKPLIFNYLGNTIIVGLILAIKKGLI